MTLVRELIEHSCSKVSICQVHGLSYRSPIVGTFPEIVG